MKDGLSRKASLSVALAVLILLGLRLFDRPGDRFWRFREMGRAVVGVGRGEFSAPDSSFLVFLALLLGAPVLGLATLALRARLRAGLPAPATANGLGCAGLLAGGVLFTFAAPIVLVPAPGAAIVVGALFASRALSLLPARGRPARSRMALLLGVAVYWLLFWTYETAMARWSESVKGAIRIDIVVAYPLLFLVTAAGVWLAFDRWSKAPAPA